MTTTPSSILIQSQALGGMVVITLAHQTYSQRLQVRVPYMGRSSTQHSKWSGKHLFLSLALGQLLPHPAGATCHGFPLLC